MSDIALIFQRQSIFSRTPTGRHIGDHLIARIRTLAEQGLLESAMAVYCLNCGLVMDDFSFASGCPNCGCVDRQTAQTAQNVV